MRRPWREQPARLLTRNALDGVFGRRRDETRVVLDSVRAFFDPELFNRFDEVITFTSIDGGVAHRIVDLEVDRLVRSLATRNVQCQVSTAARERLAEVGFDPRYGARALHRVLRHELCAPIATLMVRPDRDPARPVRIIVDRDGDNLSFLDTTEESIDAR